MVDIAPFRALRYSPPQKKKDISPYICPPYDVISPHERESIEVRYPDNIIRLELPKGMDMEKYSNAARLLREWTSAGLLQEDEQPSFYLLETIFQIKDPFAPKTKLKRFGVLAGLKIEEPGQGAVHPHEKTLPKAKEDRLNLLTALTTNVSPVFGLFFDTKKEWPRWIGSAIRSKPLVSGQEKKDLSHRLWKIDNPALLKSLKNILRKKDLYIADGHHRYEVSWAYRESRGGQSSNGNQKAGWNRVMAYICPMEESGLLMLPTHRLVRTDWNVEEWRAHLEQFFSLSPVKSMPALIQTLINPKEPMIGWVHINGIELLKLRKGMSIDTLLGHRPPALRKLNVVLLHDVIMGEAGGNGLFQEKEVVYTRDLGGMMALVKKDPRWTGFVLGSPGVDSLARVAEAGEVMPPKTTYFYPKVPTGFTMMSLEQTFE